MNDEMDLSTALAVHFHDTYERLAPWFGYDTRRESAVPWDAVPMPNRRLMVATVRVVLRETLAQGDEYETTINTLTAERDRYREALEWIAEGRTSCHHSVARAALDGES
jgi:hypothetical protein